MILFILGLGLNQQLRCIVRDRSIGKEEEWDPVQAPDEATSKPEVEKSNPKSQRFKLDENQVAEKGFCEAQAGVFPNHISPTLKTTFPGLLLSPKPYFLQF